MLLHCYRLLSQFLQILCLPLFPFVYLFLWSKNYTAAVRFQATSSERGILVHAASVGEVNAVRPLVKGLQERYPQPKIVLTTTTMSGLKTAGSLGVPCHLAVLDLPWLRKKQLQAIDPRLLIIVETEIWPNLLDQARKQKRDVVFVNARLSERSLARFKKAKGLIRSLERPVKGIFAQSATDAERFRELFSVPVHVAGNLKYAIQLPGHDSLELRRRFGFEEQDFVICLGSSRPGEEALLKGILPQLSKRIPNLKLVIAPRHPKRLNEVRALFPDACLFSELKEAQQTASDVLLVDTIGHLNEFYSICDLALVGGSFFDFAGHNPLEPAFYGKPVIMGPYHSSCLGPVGELKSDGGILISDAQTLTNDIILMFSDKDRLSQMGKNARNCITRNQQSLDEHLRGLEAWLS